MGRHPITTPLCLVPASAARAQTQKHEPLINSLPSLALPLPPVTRSVSRPLFTYTYRPSVHHHPLYPAVPSILSSTLQHIRFPFSYHFHSPAALISLRACFPPSELLKRQHQHSTARRLFHNRTHARNQRFLSFSRPSEPFVLYYCGVARPHEHRARKTTATHVLHPRRVRLHSKITPDSGAVATSALSVAA